MAVPVYQWQEEIDGVYKATFAHRFSILSRRVARNNPRDQAYNKRIIKAAFQRRSIQCILII